MKCTHCGEDVIVAYTNGKDHLCDLCLMTLTHIHYKPILCSVCNKLIESHMILTNGNDRFCSADCMAKACNFHREVDTMKEIEEVEESSKEGV